MGAATAGGAAAAVIFANNSANAGGGRDLTSDGIFFIFLALLILFVWFMAWRQSRNGNDN